MKMAVDRSTGLPQDVVWTGRIGTHQLEFTAIRMHTVTN